MITGTKGHAQYLSAAGQPQNRMIAPNGLNPDGPTAVGGGQGVVTGVKGYCPDKSVAVPQVPPPVHLANVSG